MLVHPVPLETVVKPGQGFGALLEKFVIDGGRAGEPAWRVVRGLVNAEQRNDIHEIDMQR